MPTTEEVIAKIRNSPEGTTVLLAPEEIIALNAAFPNSPVSENGYVFGRYFEMEADGCLCCVECPECTCHMSIDERLGE